MGMHVKKFEGPFDRQGWRWDTENNTFANPAFGCVEHILVCKDGIPVYDQYRIFENKGAVAVPFMLKNGQMKVGLVGVQRPVAEMDCSTELPRGFAKVLESIEQTAARELLEEGGMTATEVIYLGEGNANTAFYATRIPVYAMRVDEKFISKYIDPEIVKKLQWYTQDELDDIILENQIKCDLTLAALRMFEAFVRKSKIK